MNATLVRRLLPLYIATFFHGFVLWYVVEKLFMRSIGFDDAGIGLMVAAYSTLVLFAETPSGILADRWSRKGVLVVASVFLAIASLVCGLSTEPTLFIVGALIWGVFFALYSGTYDSIIYDTVKEETGTGDLYNKYFGRYRAVDSVALVTGAMLGGILSQWLGLSAPFFLTIPLALGAIIALWRFTEPQLHKQDRHDNIMAHIRETFSVVLGRPAMLPLVGLLVILILTIIMLYEFNQLWFIALALPPGWFGPAISASLAASGAAGYFAGKVGHNVRGIKLGLHVGLIVSGFALVLVRFAPVVMAAHFVFAFTAVALSIIATRDLHDALPSRVRAGSSSALSTMARILVVPTSLFFGAVSAQVDVFTAGWLFVVLAVTAFALELSRGRKPLVA
jgi:predicted MFS family arabinose efflux permease